MIRKKGKMNRAVTAKKIVKVIDKENAKVIKPDKGIKKSTMLNWLLLLSSGH